jgi:hypothetical protein
MAASMLESTARLVRDLGGLRGGLQGVPVCGDATVNFMSEK